MAAADELPETAYDVIVAGTGLVESIVAGAAALNGLSVLHVDEHGYYGQDHATMPFEQLNEWLEARPAERVRVVTASEAATAALQSQSRRFNLDLAPKLLLSRGRMVEKLINSDVGKYLEFKVLDSTRLHVDGDDGWQAVPGSRGDVFQSKLLTPLEKRSLMRLLKACMEAAVAEGGEHDLLAEAARAESFGALLTARGLSERLQAFVTVVLASVDPATPALAGIEAVQRYVASVGVYGPSAYLWPMYGSSEIPQAFCRLCAVHGGIYVLRRGVQELVHDGETGAVTGMVCDQGQQFSCKHYVASPSSAPGHTQVRQTVSRCICITDGPIEGMPEELQLLVLPPGRVGNAAPVKVLQGSKSAFASPAEYRVFYFVTTSSGPGKAHEDLEAAVGFVLGGPGAPSPVWTAYYDLDEEVLADNAPPNLHVAPTPDASLDYTTAIAHSSAIFSKLVPGVEFFPKPAPKEDDDGAGEDDDGDTLVMERLVAKHLESSEDRDKDAGEEETEGEQ